MSFGLEALIFEPSIQFQSLLGAAHEGKGINACPECNQRDGFKEDDYIEKEVKAMAMTRREAQSRRQAFALHHSKVSTPWLS